MLKGTRLRLAHWFSSTSPEVIKHLYLITWLRGFWECTLVRFLRKDLQLARHVRWASSPAFCNSSLPSAGRLTVYCYPQWTASQTRLCHCLDTNSCKVHLYLLSSHIGGQTWGRWHRPGQAGHRAGQANQRGKSHPTGQQVGVGFAPHVHKDIM